MYALRQPPTRVIHHGINVRQLLILNKGLLLPSSKDPWLSNKVAHDLAGARAFVNAGKSFEQTMQAIAGAVFHSIIWHLNDSLIKAVSAHPCTPNVAHPTLVDVVSLEWDAS